MTLSDISSIAISVSVALIMLMSGMLFNPAAFRRQFNRKTLTEFANLATANYLVIPLIVLGGLWLAPLDPMSKLALLTLAMLPCAPMIPALAVFCDESPDWALFVLFAMSLLNIAMVPILMTVLRLPWLAGEAAKLHGGESLAITKFMLSTYGPMALGLSLRYIAPRHLQSCIAVLRKFMSKLLLATYLLYMVAHYQDLLNLGLKDLLALALLEAVCVAVAYLFVRGATEHRITGILTCTMRNFAMGIAFTAILFAHTAAPVTMLAYATLMSLSILGAVALYQRRIAATRLPSKARETII